MDDTQKATDIIRTQGIEGANEAAWLIGTRETLSLLMTHLQGNEEKKKRQLKEAGLTETAIICPETGFGSMYIDDGYGGTKLRCLEVVGDECIDIPYDKSRMGGNWPACNSGFKWGKPKNSTHELFAGKYPYDGLKKALLRVHTEWAKLYGEDAVREARSLI